jgi:hypothetical protein
VASKRKPNPANPACPGNFQQLRQAQDSKPNTGTIAPRQTLRAQILIPKDSPITQVEIEVFAALLDDWDSLLTDSDKGTGQ